MPTDPRVRQLAERYRDHRPRRRKPSVEEYVRVMYDAYRGRRVSRLLEIVATVAALDEDGVVDGAEADRVEEAWELARPGSGIGGASADERRAALLAWRGTLFDVLARDALNRRSWVGDLVLHEGQRAVVETSGDTGLAIRCEEGVEPTPFQQRALDALAAVRALVVEHPVVTVVPGREVPGLPRRIREALGLGDGDVPGSVSGDPFEGTRSVGTAVPLLAVSIGNGELLVFEHVEPWRAIAAAQEEQVSFGDAVATGVLMMAADAGIMAVPPQVISPDGVAHIIERDRQHERLAAKMARWQGLGESAVRTSRRQ